MSTYQRVSTNDGTGADDGSTNTADDSTNTDDDSTSTDDAFNISQLPSHSQSTGHQASVSNSPDATLPTKFPEMQKERKWIIASVNLGTERVERGGKQLQAYHTVPQGALGIQCKRRSLFLPRIPWVIIGTIAAACCCLAALTPTIGSEKSAVSFLGTLLKVDLPEACAAVMKQHRLPHTDHFITEDPHEATDSAIPKMDPGLYPSARQPYSPDSCPNFASWKSELDRVLAKWVDGGVTSEMMAFSLSRASSDSHVCGAVTVYHDGTIISGPTMGKASVSAGFLELLYYAVDSNPLLVSQIAAEGRPIEMVFDMDQKGKRLNNKDEMMLAAPILSTSPLLGSLSNAVAVPSNFFAEIGKTQRDTRELKKWRWDQRMAEILRLANATPFSSRKKQALFRGSYSVLAEKFRDHVVDHEIGKESAQLNDFYGVTSWLDMDFRRVSPHDHAWTYGKNEVDTDQLCKYMVLIFLDAEDKHSQRLENMLLTGSPVVKLSAGPYFQFFEAMMEPNVHYYPVSEMSEVQPAVNYLLQNPEIAEKIGKAGQTFAVKWLHPDSIDCYFMALLAAMGPKLGYVPKAHESSIVRPTRDPNLQNRFNISENTLDALRAQVELSRVTSDVYRQATGWPRPMKSSVPKRCQTNLCRYWDFLVTNRKPPPRVPRGTRPRTWFDPSWYGYNTNWSPPPVPSPRPSPSQHPPGWVPPPPKKRECVPMRCPSAVGPDACRERCGCLWRADKFEDGTHCYNEEAGQVNHSNRSN